MKILVTLLFILQNYLLACSICATDVPQVLIDAQITSQKEKTHFDIKWKFHKEFMNSLTQYDLNDNKVFEEDEKLMIKESLTSYLEQFHYLTDIEYKHQKKLTQTKYIETITPIISDMVFTNEGMTFRYTFDLPFILKNNYKLYLGFSDEGGNFNFTLENIVLNDYPYAYTLSKNLISTSIVLSDPSIIEKKITPIVKDTKTDIIEKVSQTLDIVEKEKTFVEILGEELTEIKESLKLILQDIKENNSVLSYLWLLFFSFLYGILHAIGPGHGKSLVSSYFLNQNKSYLKAFSISSLIGVVHTFSAFILTLVVYYSVGFIFNSTLVDVEQITTKVSAVIIILIALYLIYRKVAVSEKPMSFTKVTQNSNITVPKVTHTQNLNCACSGCKTTSTDLGVILAAGIIPCPGTVTIFLFTMGLQIYFVGFLSALFMSMGMSLVIFITAVLSVKIRKSAVTNVTLIKVLEYGSLVFILLLGVVLLTVS